MVIERGHAGGADGTRAARPDGYEGATLLQNFVAIAPLVICSFRMRPDGSVSIPYANAQIEDLYGFRPEDVVDDAAPVLDRIHPDDIAYVNAAIEKSATTLEHWRCEWRVRHPARGEIWVEGHSVPTREADGSILWQGYLADIDERKRSEQAFRNRERLLSIVTGSAQVGLVVVDARYHYLFANAAYAEIFSLESDVLVGQRVPDVLADAWPLIQPQLDRALAGEYVAYALDLPPESEGEEARFYKVIYQPQTGHAGERTVVAVVMDITERKRTEQALLENESRYRTLFEYAPYGIVIADDESYYLDVNASACELFGYSREAFIGLHASDIVVAAEVDEIAAALDTLHDERDHAREWIFRDAAGGTFSAEVLATKMPDGRFLGMIRDITERKRTEQALVEKEARYRTLFEYAPDGILISDRDGRYLDANASACRMLGYTREEIAGMHVSELLAAEETDRVAAALKTLNLGGDHHQAWEVRRKDGSTFLVEAMATAMPDGNTLGMIRDITERVIAEEVTRKLEAQLQQSQKMEAFGQLAGGVAHDFNNLLTLISGYSEVLLGMLPAEDEKHGIVKEIADAGARAASLTRQLLAFSRQQVLAPKVLNINDVVADTEKMLRRLIGEDIDLVTILRHGVHPVRFDPGQMQQVIMNLAVNARDAMPQGGTLSIETKNVELDTAYTSTHRESEAGEFVMLAINDTGSGMTPAVRSRIFEPFFTTKEVGKGTGLGLAVVHGIIKQSGGNVDVYSEPGAGTSFKVYLPAAYEETQERQTAEADQSAGGDETLLVVEDEKGVRELAEMALGHFGYTVLTAENAHAAIEVMATHHDKIDLLVTDVVMPGMSGRELAETLQRDYPGLRVLFMSGYTGDAVVRHGVLLAEVAFIQKPFTPRTLARKVRDTLDQA